MSDDQAPKPIYIEQFDRKKLLLAADDWELNRRYNEPWLEAGGRFFPLRPMSKKPLPSKDGEQTHGDDDFEGITLDAAMAVGRSGGNYAMLGKRVMEGDVVLYSLAFIDFDPPKGAGEKNSFVLIDRFFKNSPLAMSPKGWHTYGYCYCELPDISEDEANRAGLGRMSIRVHHRYGLGVGSRLGSERYAVAQLGTTQQIPDEFREMVIKAKQSLANSSAPLLHAVQGGKSKRNLIHIPEDDSNVVKIPESERNNALFNKCCRPLAVLRIEPECFYNFAIKYYETYCAPPVDEKEIIASCNSAMKYGDERAAKNGCLPPERVVRFYEPDKTSRERDVRARLWALGLKLRMNIVSRCAEVEHWRNGELVKVSNLADDIGEYKLYSMIQGDVMPTPEVDDNKNLILKRADDHGERVIKSAVLALVNAHKYDPALEWLNSLPTWDPKDEHRITPISDFIGIAPEDVEMANAMYDVQFRLMTQMILTPGIRQCIVWVNWGAPNTYKSSIADSFLPTDKDWFSNSQSLDELKRLKENMRTKLFVELQEADGLTKNTSKPLSNLITSGDNTERLIFHTYAKTFLNRAMLYITTNDEQFIPPNCDGLLRRLVVTHVDRVHECWEQKGIVGMNEVGVAIAELISSERNLRFARAKWQLEQGIKAALPNHLMETVMDRTAASLETNTFWEERVRFYVEYLAPPLFLISDVISALQDSNGLSVSMPTSLDKPTKDALKRMLVQQTRRRRPGDSRIEKHRRYYVRPDWSSSDTPHKWVRGDENEWVDTEEQPIVEPPKTIDDLTEEKKRRVRLFAGKGFSHDALARGFKTSPSVIAQILGS